MGEILGQCEVASCHAVLSGKSFYDKYYRKRMCPSCFEKAFRTAEQSGLGEWFEMNYKESDYPRSFWDKVGAFIDLSKCAPKDPYGK